MYSWQNHTTPVFDTGVTLADENSYFLLDPDPIKVHHPLLPLEALFSAGRLPGLANFLSGPSPIILYPLFLGTTMAEVKILKFGQDFEAEHQVEQTFIQKYMMISDVRAVSVPPSSG